MQGQPGRMPPPRPAGVPPPQPMAPPPMHQPPLALPHVPKRFTTLRVVGVICIGSAWITLIGSIAFGLLVMLAPTPTLPPISAPAASPGPTGGYGGLFEDEGIDYPVTDPLGGLGGSGTAGLYRSMIRVARATTGLLLMASGLLGFILLMAVGQAILVLLEVEQTTRAQGMVIAAMQRRMGIG